MRQSTRGSGRIQDVELAGRRIASLARNLVATPADDQERVACGIAIDGHEVVAERPVETRGRRGGLHGDLLVQVLTCSAARSARESTSTE